MKRANDNLPEDIRFALSYLATGGLGEVIAISYAAISAGQPKVQSDPDMILALCILAQEGLDARTALQAARDGA